MSSILKVKVPDALGKPGQSVTVQMTRDTINQYFVMN